MTYISDRSSSRRHTTSSSRQRSSSVTGDRSSRRTHKNSTSPSPSNARTSIHREGPSAKTTPMHDDSDAGRLIPTVRPALAIDYLGNGWCNEDDIAASWKFMTKQKNDLINGLRLENASWRNWAKQRHHLKTVNPKTLNWLKDSDTTWLYGPLYKASIDEFDLVRFGAHTVPGGVKIPASPTLKSGLKPALKHKTASELFKADTLFHVQSDLKLSRKIEPKSKAQESMVLKQHRQPTLRFNDSVEQCVSVDTEALSDDDDLIDEDEEDAGILMRISSRRPSRSIVRINPTKLKAGSLHGIDLEEEGDNRFAGSETTYVKPQNENSDDEDEATITNASRNYSSDNDPDFWEETLDAEKAQQNGGGGFGQRAADIVSNVRDIVHWASSFVYNSSAF
ncbi:hypothetical protein BGZ46_000958 [Entomortierella lignicola]|nr:hypothetical protein BGZ46_000958 [Entomortierella lignicola]